MKLSPGMKRILKDCLSSSSIALETYGVHQILVRVNDKANRLEGNDLRRWFVENRLEGGNVVYILSPAVVGEPPRLYTAWEFRQQSGWQQPGGRRPTLQLRENVYSVLRETGRVMTVGAIAEVVKARLGRSVKEASVAATLVREHHLFSHWGWNRWGLREWGGDWRDRIDLQSLLMLIEEDLVVETLRAEGRWMTASEIAERIASRFRITVDVVLPVNIIDPRDQRLETVGGRWGLREWSSRKGVEEGVGPTEMAIESVSVDGRMSLFLRPLHLYPEFKQVVSAWALTCYGCPIDDLLKRVKAAGSTSEIKEASRV